MSELDRLTSSLYRSLAAQPAERAAHRLYCRTAYGCSERQRQSIKQAVELIAEQGGSTDSKGHGPLTCGGSSRRSLRRRNGCQRGWPHLLGRLRRCGSGTHGKRGYRLSHFLDDQGGWLN